MSFLLTQQEADTLLVIEKHYKGSENFKFPGLGGNLRIPLHSRDDREEFSLDITRGYIEIRKNTIQKRARKAIILARVDIGGPPHRNPDGEEIACPHIHIYREGFNDKWAYPLPDSFSNHGDTFLTLSEFMDYCKVATKPRIERDLFT